MRYYEVHDYIPHIVGLYNKLQTVLIPQYLWLFLISPVLCSQITYNKVILVIVLDR